jgi:magnesium chelatase subunit D
MREALASGAGLRQLSVQGIVIDTSPRPHGAARGLAEAMDAVYLALPRADAASLRDAVQANVQ